MNGMQDLLSSDEFTEVRQCLALAHRSRDRDPATIQGVSLACALLAVSWLSICVLAPIPGVASPKPSASGTSSAPCSRTQRSRRRGMPSALAFGLAASSLAVMGIDAGRGARDQRWPERRTGGGGAAHWRLLLPAVGLAAISILGLGPWAMGCACGTSKFREPIRSSTSSESVC
jgi:hypothetical protein